MDGIPENPPLGSVTASSLDDKPGTPSKPKIRRLYSNPSPPSPTQRRSTGLRGLPPIPIYK
jgi:hypothetical protein